MKFLSSKREPLVREDSVFAERLSAIASRSKANVEVDATPDAGMAPGIERRFWNPADMPDDQDYPAAA